MKDYKEDISNESLAMTHEGADETTHEMINQVTIQSTLKTEISTFKTMRLWKTITKLT